MKHNFCSRTTSVSQSIYVDIDITHVSGLPSSLYANYQKLDGGGRGLGTKLTQLISAGWDDIRGNGQGQS